MSQGVSLKGVVILSEQKIKRDEILECAFNVFTKNGLVDTVMNDIAKEANLSRRTLYRYFETKEEIAFEVMLQMLEQWNEYQKTVNADLSGTGIERLKQFLIKLIEYMDKHRLIMRFIGEFDFYFNDDFTYQPPAHLLKSYEQNLHISENLIRDIIQLGIDDNSIELTHEFEITIVTITSILWAFAQRISIYGKKLSQEYSMDVLEIVHCQVDMYIEVLSKK